MFGDAVNSADRYFYPQILNGECTYGDFTQENENGPGFTKIVPQEDGNGNNKQRCDGPDGISGNCEQINTSIKRDNLVNVLGDSIHEVGFTDIPTTPGGNETLCATKSNCEWVENGDVVGDNNNNPTKSSFSNTINSDIIGGQYKIYRKDDSTDRNYAKPCTYDVDTGKKIVLDGTLYRATNVQSTALDGTNNLCRNFTAGARESPMSFTLDNGLWYSQDEELIQDGSPIGGTTQVKKITGYGSHPTAQPLGYGSGECWQTITRITPPKYKNYTNLFVAGEDGNNERNFQNYLSGKYDSYTAENVLQEIASSDISDTIYVKKENDECGGVVDAVTQLQHAWVNTPIDCVMGSWSDFGTCSPTTGTCGSGTQTRTRPITLQASNGGTACGPTSETQGCEVTCCEMGSWSAFGTCSPTTGTCGSGTQTRTRTVDVGPSNGGTACGPASETQSCPVACGARVNFCVPWQTRWCPGVTNELTCEEYQACRVKGDSKGNGRNACGGEKYYNKYGNSC